MVSNLREKKLPILVLNKVYCVVNSKSNKSFLMPFIEVIKEHTHDKI